MDIKHYNISRGRIKNLKSIKRIAHFRARQKTGLTYQRTNSANPSDARTAFFASDNSPRTRASENANEKVQLVLLLLLGDLARGILARAARNKGEKKEDTRRLFRRARKSFACKCPRARKCDKKIVPVRCACIFCGRDDSYAYIFS